MKKVLFSVAIAAMALSMASCDNKKTAEAAEVIDSTAVAADSLSAALQGEGQTGVAITGDVQKDLTNIVAALKSGSASFSDIQWKEILEKYSAVLAKAKASGFSAEQLKSYQEQAASYFKGSAFEKAKAAFTAATGAGLEGVTDAAQAATDKVNDVKEDVNAAKEALDKKVEDTKKAVEDTKQKVEDTKKQANDVADKAKSAVSAAKGLLGK